MTFWKLAPEKPFSLRNFFKGAESFFCPRYCFSCGSLLAIEEYLLCSRCSPRLLRNQNPCPQCGLPFQGNLCPACRLKPPPFVETVAPFVYGFPLNKALQELKYKKRIHLIREISQLWKKILQLELPPDFWVCPVPLHRLRLLERGFNQSRLLAIRIFGAQRVKDLLIRERYTKPQTTLSYRERLQNVRGAFRAPNPSLIKGKKVLLFDDIFTTGATLKECAKVLLKAGAKEVRVAVIARAE